MLSVSQTNRAAQVIGRGTARVHLNPGIYHLAAVTDGKETVATATVTKHQVTVARLDFSQSVTLRSMLDVDFRNTAAIINHGLTTSQLNSLERGFFRFRPTAKTVTINPASVKSPPHNIVIDGATFKLNFKVTVDTSTYAATTLYSGFDTIRLLLYDRSGSLVFDSQST
jgi:hypothetical protein